jgi:hypothetical protein
VQLLALLLAQGISSAACAAAKAIDTKCRITSDRKLSGKCRCNLLLLLLLSLCVVLQGGSSLAQLYGESAHWISFHQGYGGNRWAFRKFGSAEYES